MSDPMTYELIEDVPANVTRVVSKSGRTNATRCSDGRWYRIDSSHVPLDAYGPWIPVQFCKCGGTCRLCAAFGAVTPSVAMALEQIADEVEGKSQ